AWSIRNADAQRAIHVVSGEPELRAIESAWSTCVEHTKVDRPVDTRSLCWLPLAVVILTPAQHRLHSHARVSLSLRLGVAANLRKGELSNFARGTACVR